MAKAEEKVELIRDFIKEMVKQGYALWYIGKQIALLIKALDTKEAQ